MFFFYALFQKVGDKLILTLPEARTFLRLEPDFIDDDELITSLITASEAYICNATDKTFSNTDELVKLCTKLLLSHWYENRNTVVVGSITKSLEYSLQAILEQLSFGGEGVLT